MNKRFNVKNVFVSVMFPGGQHEKITIAGDESEGLFFNERAATQILAPFYKTYRSAYTRETLSALCGDRAIGLMKGKEKLVVTPQLVETLWNLEDENGMLPPFLIKDTKCTPRLKSIIGYDGHEKVRPSVTGIDVEVQSIDGAEYIVPVDASTTEGLFWSDRSVIEILSPFYNSNERILSRKEMVRNFGKHGLERMKDKLSLTVTPQLIEEFWNRKDETGMLAPFAMKTTECTPRIPGVPPMDCITSYQRKAA